MPGKKISIWDMAIIGRNNVEALEHAISDGANVFEILENNYSLLHCAAENNAKENVVLLLKRELARHELRWERRHRKWRVIRAITRLLN